MAEHTDVAASISAIRAAIALGRDPQALVTPLWERAGALEPKLRAFAHLPDSAPDAAASGPLAGVTVGIKDLIDTADMPTACGSPIHESRQPDTDAEIVMRLRALGATVLGKTVTTEFAWRHAGSTGNPWNLEHTPGGSSSGSAAAVAAGIVTLALGTQTFGSVIRPAAFCGVVGFKPSFGALPRDGVQPLSPSLDHVGLFARTVEDVALAYSLLAGAGVPQVGTSSRPVGSLKVAVPALAFDAVDAEQATLFGSAWRRLVEAGAEVEAVDLRSMMDRLQAAADTLVAVEAARELGDLQTRFPDKTSAVLSELIAVGRSTSELSYEDALRAQRDLREEVAKRLDGYDAVLTIPAPGAAPHGLGHTGDARFCTPWTALGYPAITLPGDLSRSGLPLGLQLIARFGDDLALLSMATTVEALISSNLRPAISP